MTHHTAVLTRVVISLEILHTMSATKGSSWLEIGIKSASKLATGMEVNQFANVSNDGMIII